jgi:transposase InsO family protein
MRNADPVASTANSATVFHPHVSKTARIRSRFKSVDTPLPPFGYVTPDRGRRTRVLEFATLTWVDWFNHRRLLEPIGYVPPAEYEARYYDQAAVA